MEKITKSVNKKLSNELKKKTVLITGGAGSIGTELVKKLLKFPVSSVRVLDIDEYALFKLEHELRDPRLRGLLGSITDIERVEMAFNEADLIIHTAAIKNIEISEFNPIETINTNINGTVNLIKTSIKTKPKKFLNISTDKATDPSTLYGVTKQINEKLTSWAGFHVKGTKFASARLGNVFETRGNVFEIWKTESANNKPIPITDPKMNRYFFHVSEAVDFILECVLLMNKGEIFVPKMKLYNIKDLSKAFSDKYKIIGLRQGEKMEEILISNSELTIAKEKKNMWIIHPYGEENN